MDSPRSVGGIPPPGKEMAHHASSNLNGRCMKCGPRLCVSPSPLLNGPRHRRYQWPLTLKYDRATRPFLKIDMQHGAFFFFFFFFFLIKQFLSFILTFTHVSSWQKLFIRDL